MKSLTLGLGFQQKYTIGFDWSNLGKLYLQHKPSTINNVNTKLASNLLQLLTDDKFLPVVVLWYMPEYSIITSLM